MTTAQPIFDLIKDGTAIDLKYRYSEKIGDKIKSKIHQRKYVIESLCKDFTDIPARTLAGRLYHCVPRTPCNQPYCPMCRHKQQAKFSRKMVKAFGHVPVNQLRFITILYSVHYDPSAIALYVINDLKKQFRNVINHLPNWANTDLRFLGAFEIEALLAKSITTPNKIAALDPLGRDPSSDLPFYLLHFHAVIDLGSMTDAHLRKLLTRNIFPHPYQVRIQQLHSDKSVKENLKQLASYMLKFRLQHSDRLKFDQIDNQPYQRSVYQSLYDPAIAKAVVMAVDACNSFHGLIFKSL
jgi:hypothetical protein